MLEVAHARTLRGHPPGRLWDSGQHKGILYQNIELLQIQCYLSSHFASCRSLVAAARLSRRLTETSLFGSIWHRRDGPLVDSSGRDARIHIHMQTKTPSCICKSARNVEQDLRRRFSTKILRQGSPEAERKALSMKNSISRKKEKKRNPNPVSPQPPFQPRNGPWLGLIHSSSSNVVLCYVPYDFNEISRSSLDQFMY